MANIMTNEFTETYRRYKEHQTRRTRLYLAWSALMMAKGETTNQDMAWYWVDQACRWASDAGTTLRGFGDHTWPVTRAAHEIINEAINGLAQKGTK